MIRPANVACTIGLAVVSMACAVTTIGQVVADPTRYVNHQVTVRGEVAAREAAQDTGVYRIRDGAAELWVLSTDVAPPAGSTVDVTGRVRDGFDLRSLTSAATSPAGALVLAELSHRIVP